MSKEIYEAPMASRKKKIKFHLEMFRTDGVPDSSLILERGMHLNDLALQAFAESEKDYSLEDILSHDQKTYIEKVHFPQCEECRKRFEAIRLKRARQKEMII